MASVLWVGVAVGVALLQPAPSFAQCAFNVPAKAKGYKLNFVRAFAECPSVTPAPNTMTKAGTPACSPPVPLSEFQFDENGKCSLTAGQAVQSPCRASGAPSDCTVLRLKARCAGVLEPASSGSDPISGVDWMLALGLRITADFDDGGPMTIVDFAVSIPFPAARNGRLTMATLGETACDLGMCLTDLPPCASMELLSASIIDPNGDVFARAGSSSR